MHRSEDETQELANLSLWNSTEVPSHRHGVVRVYVCGTIMHSLFVFFSLTGVYSYLAPFLP